MYGLRALGGYALGYSSWYGYRPPFYVEGGSLTACSIGLVPMLTARGDLVPLVTAQILLEPQAKTVCALDPSSVFGECPDG